MEVFKQNDRLVINSIQASEQNTYYKIRNNINAKVEINVYDADANLLLETLYFQLYDVSNYILFNDTYAQIIIDTEGFLRSRNYNTGNFRVTYKFYTNILGSESDSEKVLLYKISSSRKEISIKYVGTNDTIVSNLKNLSNQHFNQFGPEFAFTKYTNFGSDTLLLILNAKNEFDSVTNLYTSILKLYTPVPISYIENAPLWLVELYSDEISDITLLLPGIGSLFEGVYILQAPNFANNGDKLYRAYDSLQSKNDLLSDSIEYGDLYEPLISATSKSYLYGIELNVDYSDFENFVHFGSAAQIIDNFKKKVELIQYYDTQSLYRNTSFTDSSSAYNKAKKSDIIKEFTRYERFLYFNTGSAFTSSLEDDGTANISPYNNFCIGDGTNLIITSTWPKSGTVSGSGFPYILAPIADVTASAWVDLMIRVGMQYDTDNRDYLLNTVPEYIRTDVDNNPDYISFINMMGEFYDNIWVYINSYYSLLKRENKISETMPNELIWDVLKNHGIDINNTHDAVDLGKYAYGLYPSSSISSYTVEIKKAQKDISLEIWNRLLNNLPYLFKSKGTKKSIEGLLNCYGVPKDLITIREFGGPYSSSFSGSANRFDTYNQKYQFIIDDFTHVVDFTGNQYINIPWSASVVPDTMELKFRTVNSSAPTMSLFTKVSAGAADFDLTLYKYTQTSATDMGYLKFEFQSGSHESMQSSPFHFYNGAFYNVFIERGNSINSTATQSYYMYVKKFDEDTTKIVINDSSSFIAFGNNPSWYNSGSLYLGSGSSNSFSGSMDEFRLWTEPLTTDVLNWHTQYWQATNGNYFTSSMNTLQLRLSFNTPVNLSSSKAIYNEAYTTSSIEIVSASGFTNLSTYPYNFSAYERVSLVENNFVAPDSVNSEKIRIENNAVSQWITLSDGYIIQPLRMADTSNYQNMIYNKSSSIFVPIEGEQSPFRYADKDSDKLLIGFAPAQLINNNMIAFFGNTSLLSNIGGYSSIHDDYYPSIDSINDYYWKYAKNGTTFFEYIDYIRMYDKNMFEQIEKFVPAQATVMLGTVYESTMIHRNRIRLMHPETAFDYNYGTSNPLPASLQVNPFGDSLYKETALVVKPKLINSNVIGLEDVLQILETSANSELISINSSLLNVNAILSTNAQNVGIMGSTIAITSIPAAFKVLDLQKDIQLEMLSSFEVSMKADDFLNDTEKKQENNATITQDSDTQATIEIINVPTLKLVFHQTSVIPMVVKLSPLPYNSYSSLIEYRVNRWNLKWPALQSINKTPPLWRWTGFHTISTSADTPDGGPVVELTKISPNQLSVNFSNNPQLIIQ